MNTGTSAPSTPPLAEGADVQPLLLYTYLDEAEARAVAEALDRLPAGTHVEVRIHSVGGDIYSGLAIYNQLLAARQRGLRITTRIDGLAASMASVVAMAGERIRMAENAELMVHNPWTRMEGGSQDLRNRADQLDRLKAQLVQIYAVRSQQPANDIAQLMDTERWFTAAEAKQLGLVDEVIAARLVRKRVAENAAPDAKHQAYKVPRNSPPCKGGDGGGKSALPTSDKTNPQVSHSNTTTPDPDACPGPRFAVERRGVETTDLRAELARLQAELAKHEVEMKLLAAVREGRIAEAQLPPLRALAQASAPQVFALLATLPPAPRVTPLAQQLVGWHPAPPIDGCFHPDPGRRTWTLRDWEKRDPEGLAQLRQHHPDTYAALFNATYRTTHS